MRSPASSFSSIAMIPVALGSTRLAVSLSASCCLAFLSTVFTGWPTWAMHCCPFHTPAEAEEFGACERKADVIAHQGLRWEGTPPNSAVSSHHTSELGDCASMKFLPATNPVC